MVSVLVLLFVALWFILQGDLFIRQTLKTTMKAISKCTPINQKSVYCGPDVGLILCCFVVYSTRRFVLCLILCYFVLVFFSPFSIAITSLGEERANLSAFCGCLVLLVSSSSWCLGRAAVCYCGTPWTFLLPFFFNILYISAELPFNLRADTTFVYCWLFQYLD